MNNHRVQTLYMTNGSIIQSTFQLGYRAGLCKVLLKNF